MPHFTREQLEQAVREGRDLSGLDFTSDAHIEGVPSILDVDLNGIQIPEAKMNDSIFNGLELNSGGNYRGINLRGAQLVGCDMIASDFTDATFDDADLTGAIMTGSTFTRASFKRAVMVNVVANPATFIDADLSAADIQGADFRDSDMRGATISRAWTNAQTKLMGTIFDDGTVPG